MGLYYIHMQYLWKLLVNYITNQLIIHVDTTKYSYLHHLSISSIFKLHYVTYTFDFKQLRYFACTCIQLKLFTACGTCVCNDRTCLWHQSSTSLMVCVRLPETIRKRRMLYDSSGCYSILQSLYIHNYTSCLVHQVCFALEMHITQDTSYMCMSIQCSVIYKPSPLSIHYCVCFIETVTTANI